MSTIDSVRARLAAQKGDWPQICREAQLTYWWLTKFAQGRIAEPGHAKIERLTQWLDARELRAA